MSRLAGQALPLMRSSERSAFHRCPQAWWWGYVEGITPIAEKKVHADFGTIVHLCMEHYYQPGTVRGPHPAETWSKLAKDMINVLKNQETIDGELITTWEDFYKIGLDLLEEYVRHYGGDPHWDIIDTERRFSITIPDVRYAPIIKDGKKGYRPICNLVGVFDVVLRDLNDGRIKMVDHKTANQISTIHLDMDPQASTYISVATKVLRDQGLIKSTEAVNGMEYNFLRKGKLYKSPLKPAYVDAMLDYFESHSELHPYTEKELNKMLKVDLEGMARDYDVTVLGEKTDNPLYRRIFVPRTPKQRNKTIMRISQEAAVMERMASGDIPVTKSFAKDCYYCKFYDLCELDENGENTDYFKSTVYKKINPYGDHETKKLDGEDAAADSV